MGIVDVTRGQAPLVGVKRRKSGTFPRGAVERLSVVEAAAYLFIFSGVVAILYYGSSVLMPLALAGLLSFVLTPPIRFLKKTGIPKFLSVIVVVIVSIFAIGGVGFIVGDQISDLLEDIPSYEYNLLKKVSSVRSASVESSALERARSTLEDLKAALGEPNSSAATTTTTPSPAGPTVAKPIAVEIHQPPPPILDATLSLIHPLISPLATTGLIVLFLFFILAQREDLRDRFLRLAGAGDLQRTTVALDDAGDRLSRFFIIQALLNTGFGIFIGVTLWLMGLPNAMLWGILAGLMRFVPFIGSVIASVFPIILAAAIDPGWTLVLSTAALFLVSELVAGEVIEPMLYGRNTGLSPVAIVVATLFWTLLWGPIGLILATPLTVCLMVLGKYVEGLHFLEILFGDEPALEPHERLYQRVLAGDGIEAIEVAEQSIKDMPLIDYYDGVAMKALSMAYDDASSGRLSIEEIGEVNDAMDDVIDGLSVHTKPSKDGPNVGEVGDVAEGENCQVICFPVRSQLDEAPLSMLAQMLGEKAIKAKSLPYKASIRSQAIDGFPAAAHIVFLGFLGSNKLPAFLRILVRRVRDLRPDAVLVLCLWAVKDNAQLAERWREASGADRVVTNLKDAVALSEELLNGGPNVENGGLAENAQAPVRTAV